MTKKTTVSKPKTSVLILNSNGKKPPIITDTIRGSGYGKVAGYDFNFMYGEGTSAYMACSMLWQNEFYIFGGNVGGRQVSQLVGCRLELQGYLDFVAGEGCTNFNEEKIFLCFSYKDSKLCRYANEPLGVYQNAKNSSYHHRSTRIASSNGKPLLTKVEKKHYFSEVILAVGSYYDPDSYTKAEILSVKHDNWYRMKDYPFD